MNIEHELKLLRAQVQRLQDRQDVLDCIQRESRARDRQDVDQINGCWWEDGIDEHGSVITGALEYAQRANAGHRAGFAMTSHNITNHLCHITGNTANCESYVIGGLFWKDGKKATLACGRYLDGLEKRNGEWRLLVRRCTIELTLDGSAEWVYSDAVKGFLKARWDGADPANDRPYVAGTEGQRW